MVSPQLGTGYNEDSPNQVLARMANFHRQSVTMNQSYWQQADIDSRFFVGDQSLWNEFYGSLPLHQRKQFNFNRIRRIINMVSGKQRQSRKSIIATPVSNADEVTASQFTKVMMWSNQRDNVLETVSDAFEGALVTGMNLLQVYLDYRNDAISGDIKVDNCSYNSYLIDPFFKKSDLSDCNGLWKRSFLSKQECASLLPDHKKDIEAISTLSNRDGKFPYMPENLNAGTSDLLSYDEFYYKSSRTQRMLVDAQTGETMEWNGEDDALRQFLNLYPRVTVIDQEVPTVKLSIVVQDQVMYDGANPLGIDKYPFVPVFGYYNPQIPYYEWRIQGMVRGLRDSQFLYNRRKIIELDMLESQITGGWIHKEGALKNPKDVYLTGQGKSLVVDANYSLQDIQPIQPPQIPPSMLEVSKGMGDEMQNISGVNEELLGSAVDDKAGILSKLRQEAGLVTLQGLFDGLDRSQRQLGNLLINVIQTNFAPGKVKRIIEEEPAPQFFNKAFGIYDAAVEDGLNTTTQRQMQFVQLLSLKEAGVNIPDEVLLEASTVQNKKELTDAVKAANDKQAQVEEMKMQVELQEIQARSELSHARAIADKGLGLERISRIEENEALAIERRAEAQKDREMGMLTLVKTLKEIDDIDLTQIERLVSISNALKAQEDTAVDKPKSAEKIAADKMMQNETAATSPEPQEAAAEGQTVNG